MAHIEAGGCAPMTPYPISVPIPDGVTAPSYRRDVVRARDGAELVLHSWSPADRPPRAILLFLPGIGLYGAPYEAIAAGFASNDIVIAVPDLRGHGDSAGRRGTLPRARVLRRDLDDHFDVLRKRHPNVPSFMGGESMGGLLASEYALCRQEHLRGLCIMAPAFQVHPSRFLARQHIGKLLRGQSFIDSEDNLRQSSRDEGFILAKQQDPKALSSVSIFFYLGRLGVRGLRWHFVAKRMKLPLLVILAGQDCIISNSVARRIYRWVGTEESARELHEWGDARHTLCWDPDTVEVVSRTAEWLTQHIGLGQPVS